MEDKVGRCDRALQRENRENKGNANVNWTNEKHESTNPGKKST